MKARKRAEVVFMRSKYLRFVNPFTAAPYAMQRALRFAPLPLGARVALDLFPRPDYAWGVYSAARQAVLLGKTDMAVIEFGVAGGKGLLALANVAHAAARQFGISISVYGFDAKGLPRSQDHRDTPYIYQEGFFAMDEDALRAKLHDAAELVLGSVSETIPQFLHSLSAPIGFVALDLDYYTSTRDALSIFEATQDHYIPRPIIYADDIMSSDETYRCEFVGPELAISEFNERHANRKIGQIRGLSYSRAFPAAWNEKMYVCHMFDDPDYSTFIGAWGGQQLKL